MYTNSTKTDRVLRPITFDDYIGQATMKEQAMIKINKYRKTGDMFGHILLLGFAGAGKTTLAKVIANTMGVAYVEKSATSISNWKEMISLLISLEDGAVIFIDEIHNLKSEIQQNLLITLEDGEYDMVNPYTKRSMRKKLPKFTLIGATTHVGQLNMPFVERFAWKPTLAPYTYAELTEILTRACKRIYEIDMPKEIASRMSRLCQWTPRRAISLLNNYMDMVEGCTPDKVMPRDMTMPLLERTLRGLEVDPMLGMDRPTRQYINTLLTAEGKPLGLRALSSMTRLEQSTIEYMIEPFLTFPDLELPVSQKEEDGEWVTIMNVGPMVKITRLGRVPTKAAVDYVRMCKLAQSTQGWFPGERFAEIDEDI